MPRGDVIFAQSEWPRRVLQLVTSRQNLLIVARPPRIRTSRFGILVLPAIFGAKRRRGGSYAPIAISPAAALSFGRRRAGDFSSDFLDSEKRFCRRRRHKFLDTWLVRQLGCRSAAAGMVANVDPL